MHAPDRVEHVRRPDGCSIAYRVYNANARKTIVLCNGLGCSESMWRHLLDDLATDHQIITWDYRGQGDSSHAEGPGAYSASAHAADLAAVQDAVGVEIAAHLGFGLGALITLEHHSWAPERVEALVLIQGGFSLTTGKLSLIPGLARRALGEMAPFAPLAGRLLRHPGRQEALRLAYRAARRANLVGRTCNIEDFAHLVSSLSEQTWGRQLALARGVARHRSSEVLAKVKVPTLVFASTRDPLCPESLMRQVHESLHNSEYVRLPGASHACLLDLGPFVAARVRRFLEERRRQSPWKVVG